MTEVNQTSLGPLRLVPLRARVHESLLTAIVRCELVPGTSLKDRELAERLGVSRTPVREALQLLEFAGLVTSTARAGWRVSPIDAEDLEDLFELRRVLEPLGIDALERNPDEATIRRVAGFFEEFSDFVDPSGELPHERLLQYQDRDHAFHLTLIECSGNRRAIDFYGIISHHINRGRHYLLGTGGADGPTSHVDFGPTHRDHMAVCQAVGERDFDVARTALHRHLRYGQNLMVDRLASPRSSPSERAGQPRPEP